MSSWFKRRGSDEEYELLNPLPLPPRRGPSQMLKYAVGSGILCLGVTACLVVLILNGTAPIVTTSEDNAGGTTLLKATRRKPARLTFEAAESEAVEGDTSTVGPWDDILVEVDQGALTGMKLKSRGGRDYLAFLGIPYAKPPMGELRFQPPVEAEPWEGTLNATKFSSECIQKDKYNVNLVVKGAEDCLYLNIYTPKKYVDLDKRRNRYPVMLYIHGGGVYGNASRYRADYFMDEDVVFVTMQYRLGALGNLNTNDSAARGNQGLKDQVMAMEWIKDNIKHFGGNRRKVTIFGNSYGGMEVHAHLLSPMSKGLFHRAICQSGVLLFPGNFTDRSLNQNSSVVSLPPGMVNENPAKTSYELGRELNCTMRNSMALVDCLRRVPAEDIIRASFDDPFVISIEPPSENDNEDTILPGHPLKLLQNGEINNVPVMFGVTSAEALPSTLGILVSPNLTNSVNENFNELMGHWLMLDVSASDPTVILEAAHQFYFGNKNVSRETERNLTNLITDRDYIHPTTVAASFQSENNGRQNKVFLYYFNYEVPQKYSRQAEALYKPTEFLGASHADELQLLFPYDDFPYIPLDSDHANMSLTMVKLWVSFAENGEPSGTRNEWLPIMANEKPCKFFELNSNSFKMVDPVGERMKFWDGFNLTDLYESNGLLNSSLYYSFSLS